MMCFTLDSNCIIDLEDESRANSHYIRGLTNLWKRGKIDLAVVSASASENQKNGISSRDYRVFEARLEKIGLLDARELPPVGIWDFGYWDHFLWSDEEMERQVSAIRDVLFPHVGHSPPVDSDANSKWRNQMCDVLIAWAHGFHSSDYLVTSDQNFHRKKKPLEALGVTHIVTPARALELAQGA